MVIGQRTSMSALKTGTDSDRIDVILDMYNDIIKNLERENRRSGPEVLLTNTVTGHKIQQWKIQQCIRQESGPVAELISRWPSQYRRLEAGCLIFHVT